MRYFLADLWKNISASFFGRNIFWHLLAILITWTFVMSGSDWFYFTHTRNMDLILFFLPAAIIGFIVPVFVPLILFLVGFLKKSKKIFNTAYVMAQAEIVAWLISSLYKALTGRAYPALFNTSSLIDISREFHFGFLKGGIFWGWPSSHAIVACAIAASLFFLYPKNLKIKLIAAAYALYVGIGVSMTIHWLSDAVAGSIIGIVVGVVVGRRGAANG